MKCEKCGGETSILHNGICFDCAIEMGTLPNTLKTQEMKKCRKCGREVGYLIEDLCGVCAFNAKYTKIMNGIRGKGGTKETTRPCVVGGEWKGIWHGWVKAEVEFYGIVEDETGDIYRVKCESIRFLDTEEQMGKLDPYFERAKGRTEE